MARSDRDPSQKGAALITALLTAALLLAIAVTAAEQAWMSFLIVHRSRESVEAMVAAETGLSAALADLAMEPSFDRFDLAAGTPYPFARASAIAPLPASFAVRLEIRPRSAGRIDILVRASGRNRAGRTLAATIERSEDPYVPAAFYAAGAAPSIATSSRLEISGSSAPANPVPAIGAQSSSDAESIHRELAAAGADLAGIPIASASAWSDLPEILARVREAAGALPDVVDGERSTAILSSSGAVEVTSASGSGVWLVDGDLTVRSRLSFEGLLLVLGDIVLAEGSDVRIHGALVQAPPGRAIQARGDAVVAYRSTPLQEIDSAHPGLLGRRARIIGWRDES
jgi:hypothetical protein